MELAAEVASSHHRCCQQYPRVEVAVEAWAVELALGQRPAGGRREAAAAADNPSTLLSTAAAASSFQDEAVASSSYQAALEVEVACRP